ncbi:unnamed protein product, partial [Closterium sp. NIES-53]
GSVPRGGSSAVVLNPSAPRHTHPHRVGRAGSGTWQHAIGRGAAGRAAQRGGGDDNRGILSDLLWPLHHSHHAHGLPREHTHPNCVIS